jgi:RHS repeat-associated protein
MACAAAENEFYSTDDQTRVYNSRNQLITLGALTLTYDNNGNMTTDDHGNTLAYDAWNRLVAVTHSATPVETFAYDGLGRRIQQAAGNATDLYYTAAWQIAEERGGVSATSNGSVGSQNVWSPVYVNALVLRDTYSGSSVSERLYFTSDANYDVTSAVSTGGAVVEHVLYTSYGTATFTNSDWTSPPTVDKNLTVLWQGGHWNAAIQSYDFQRRFYSPSLMVWMTSEPSGAAYVDGPGLQQFVHDNPISRRDFTGLQVVEDDREEPRGEEGNGGAVNSLSWEALEARYLHHEEEIREEEEGEYARAREDYEEYVLPITQTSFEQYMQRQAMEQFEQIHAQDPMSQWTNRMCMEEEAARQAAWDEAMRQQEQAARFVEEHFPSPPIVPIDTSLFNQSVGQICDPPVGAQGARSAGSTAGEATGANGPGAAGGEGIPSAPGKAPYPNKAGNGFADAAKGAPKSSPNFQPPTNAPQLPPTDIPPGWRVRQMPPTEQYPNGYWKLEKPMTDGSWQPIDPSTMKPGGRPQTHVPLPPPSGGQ